MQTQPSLGTSWDGSRLGQEVKGQGHIQVGWTARDL